MVLGGRPGIAVITLVTCWLGSACATGRFERAQAAFADAVRLKNEGKYADALRQAERARGLAENLWGPNHLEVARCLGLAGTPCRLSGGLDRAEKYHRRALSIREQALSNDDPLVAESLFALASVYEDQGRYPQAIVREAPGPAHPRVAYTLQVRGDILLAAGLYDQAENFYRQALSILEAASGPKHPDVVMTLEALAVEARRATTPRRTS